MSTSAYFLPRAQLQSLIDSLLQTGYDCIGPTRRDGAIVYESINQVTQLPRGIRDRQEPGHYRLETGDDEWLFAWANGPQNLKPLLFRPRETLWTVNKHSNGQLDIQASEPASHKRAVIGVRACDIAALYLHDQHFLQAEYKDPYYLAQRQDLLIIAVNCTHPAETCFCASTGDGPAVSYGYDIAMTEQEDGFVVHAHSEHGMTQLERLQLSEASAERIEQTDTAMQQAINKQTRHLPNGNLQNALFKNLQHPHWDDIARRCLSCGNCTAVCPSCFCHSESDEGDLDLSHSEHVRQWDSCFTEGHSYIHGITIRSSTAQRYRQWLTHKLGSWHEQYGRSGCVGCGRCISWCPVGIDLTEEVPAIIGDEP